MARRVVVTKVASARKKEAERKKAEAARAVQERSDMELANKVLIFRGQGKPWEAISLETGEPWERCEAVYLKYLARNIAFNTEKLVAEELNHLRYLTSLLAPDLMRGEMVAFDKAKDISRLRKEWIDLALNAARQVNPSLPPGMLINQPGSNPTIVQGGTVIDYPGQLVAIEAGGGETEYIQALEAASRSTQQQRGA